METRRPLDHVQGADLVQFGYTEKGLAWADQSPCEAGFCSVLSGKLVKKILLFAVTWRSHVLACHPMSPTLQIMFCNFLRKLCFDVLYGGLGATCTCGHNSRAVFRRLAWSPCWRRWQCASPIHLVLHGGEELNRTNVESVGVATRRSWLIVGPTRVARIEK